MSNKYYRKVSLTDSAFKKATIEFLQNMLLFEKVRLADIPFEVRSINNSIYIAACRAGRRQGDKQLKETLSILKNDMPKLGQRKQAAIQNIIEGYQILLE